MNWGKKFWRAVPAVLCGTLVFLFFGCPQVLEEAGVTFYSDFGALIISDAKADKIYTAEIYECYDDNDRIITYADYTRVMDIARRIGVGTQTYTQGGAEIPLRRVRADVPSLKNGVCFVSIIEISGNTEKTLYSRILFDSSGRAEIAIADMHGFIFPVTLNDLTGLLASPGTAGSLVGAFTSTEQYTGSAISWTNADNNSPAEEAVQGTRYRAQVILRPSGIFTFREIDTTEFFHHDGAESVTNTLPLPTDNDSVTVTIVFPPMVRDLATPLVYRSMVSLAGGTITGSADYNSLLFIEGRTVTLSPFRIAAYETTYELWHEVKTWAASRGYTFANPGREGFNGTEELAPTDGAKREPVANINWRDAIIWCNAYSEMSGKTPVYYTDAFYTTVLRTSTNDEGTATPADLAVMKPDANGYRLPTEAEWEYAARGGPVLSTDTWAGTNTPGELDDYAWYYYNAGDPTTTHEVGTKLPNAAGLYDMSGNVYEWCWDWYSDEEISTGLTTDPPGPDSGETRVVRGGSVIATATYCAVADRLPYHPAFTFEFFGLRVVCRP